MKSGMEILQRPLNIFEVKTLFNTLIQEAEARLSKPEERKGGHVFDRKFIEFLNEAQAALEKRDRDLNLQNLIRTCSEIEKGYTIPGHWEGGGVTPLIVKGIANRMGWAEELAQTKLGMTLRLRGQGFEFKHPDDESPGIGR